MLARGFICLLVLSLVGCTGIPLKPRLQKAETLAASKSWQRLIIPTGPFDLVAYAPQQFSTSEPLTLYIEGDGLAWVSSSRISDNPTPRKPIGLGLALQHPRTAVAYLARPCQYVTDTEARGCNKIYWTSHRFAPEVISATNNAIDNLKQHFNAKKIVLVGYSGGGAIAALVATLRNDVIKLITVAGNLDHASWTQQKKLSPLYGSLNPADSWRSLINIPQLHFIGGRDSMIGRDVTESYIGRFPAKKRPSINVIEEFDHACCWVERWSKLFPASTL